MNRSIWLLPVAVVVLALVFSSIYVVDERQKALVLQFGRVVDVKTEPGLSFKVPFIQDVAYYDDRILSRDFPPIEVTPSDDRRLVVDAFARYRIADLRQFREANPAAGIEQAESRLDGIISSQLRAVLGSVSSDEILSEDRATLMQEIAENVRSRASNLGLQIIDVRLKRTDLPSQNLDATFARMRAEREREAADEVARGEEAAQRIRAQADRTVIELTSEATREAEIARGEADARRNSVFADAYSADPEFFEFYRSLSAYTRALQGSNSTLVLSPDSEFFDYLKTDRLPDTPARPQTAQVEPADPVGNAAEGDDADLSPQAITDDTPPAQTQSEDDQPDAEAPAGTDTPADGTEAEAEAEPVPAE